MKLNLTLEFIILILLFENSLTYYSECERAFQNQDPEALLKALRVAISSGKSGSYADLWNTYLSAFVKQDGYIKDYYSSYSKFTSEDRDTGSGGTVEGDKYNREHTIPKSWWGGSTAAGTQGADPFIVVPADKFINNKRSNYPLGKVNKATFSSYDGYSKLGSADESYGYSGTVFEPNDEVKGDLARSVFYSIVKYSNSYKWTSSGGSAYYTGNESKNFGLTDYAVKLFTEWNEIDPPDEWEINLNKAIFGIQGNANPFIDHPEYINVIWGQNSEATYYTGTKNPIFSKLEAFLQDEDEEAENEENPDDF